MRHGAPQGVARSCVKTLPAAIHSFPHITLRCFLFALQTSPLCDAQALQGVARFRTAKKPA
jgi:hypothetical protein